MKKSPDDLFNLVLSLSKGEKIFFKNYLKGTLPGKSNYYMKLFDLIQRSKNPDEEKIKKQLGAKNYSKIKWYLYESITECLRLYYKDSPDNPIAIHNLILNALILEKKALQLQSINAIKKAEEIALEEERFASLQEIHFMRAKLLRNPAQLELLNELNQNWLNATLDAIEKSKNIAQYTDLLNKLTWFIRSKGETIRDPKDLDEICQLMDSPLLQDEEKAITHTSKMFFLNINSIFSYIKGDYKMAYYYSSRLAEFSLSNRRNGRIKNDPGFYIIANAAQYAIYIKKWEEAKNHIRHLKKIKPVSRQAYYNQLQLSLNLELFCFNKSAEFENALLIIKQNEETIKKYRSKIDPVGLSAIYANIAETYFLAGNLKASLDWIKPVLFDKLKPSEAMLVSGKMFLMVLYYELKDYDALDQIQESLYRYLSYRNKLFDFEKTMITFFRKLFRCRDEEEKISLFKNLLIKLHELNKNPLNYIIMRIEFDYMIWAESKIKKTKYVTLLKEKVLALA